MAGVAGLIALPALSATVSLVPSSTAVTVGETFTVDLVLDAADAAGNQPGSFRGKVLVNFGTNAAYQSFVLADPSIAFGATTVNASSIALGFDNAAGVGVIGTFSFLVTGNVGDTISLGIQDGVPFISSFFNTDPTVKPFTPDFVGANVSVVPLPAAAWLMMGGLAALGGFARRRRS